MRTIGSLLGAILLVGVPVLVLSESPSTVRPLFLYKTVSVSSALPSDTVLLTDPTVIERLLEELDGRPPDWKAIYGTGDEAHMDRLFALNRERDRLREGRPALHHRIAFVWEGVVSGYDHEAAGFRLAIGPKVIPTSWGQVRFKPHGLPAGLIAVPEPRLREELRMKKGRGEEIAVDLVLTGQLVPEESIIYDFAHEEPGQGMIMPVVQVEQIDYFLAK